MRSTAKCPIGNKLDPQKTMAATTYLRRYGIQATLGLPAVDDDGNRASGNEPPDMRKFLHSCQKINRSISSLNHLNTIANGMGFDGPLERMTRETLREVFTAIKEESRG